MDWQGWAGGGRAAAWGNPESAAGVVVLPEVFGVVDSVVDYAIRLSRQYRVFVVDYWSRLPRPEVHTPEAVSAAVGMIDDGSVMRDVAAARALLGDRPVAVLGFCVGGLYARLASSMVPNLAGAVEFYGRIVYPTLSERKPVQPLDLILGRSCPLLAHFGSQDPLAPEVHIDELERRLGRQPVPARVYRYAGCGHAFMNAERPSWNEAAAALAWSRSERFLADVLRASQ